MKTKTKEKKSYNFSLPKEKSKPETDLGKYTILLYGQEKIGKTTFASCFPNPIFLLFEPGAKALSIHKKEILDWRHFRGVLSRIESDSKFDTVVFDTADVAYAMCERYVCEKLGITDPQDEDFGKGWRKIKQEFTHCILRLTKTGKGVIFTSHETARQFKRRGGDSTDRTVPTMSKQAREILEPIVDIWVYYHYTNSSGERQFVVRGDEEISAGTRTKNHFKGIKTIPAGSSEEEAYENFLAGFENRLKPKMKFKIKK